MEVIQLPKSYENARISSVEQYKTHACMGKRSIVWGREHMYSITYVNMQGYAISCFKFSNSSDVLISVLQFM